MSPPTLILPPAAAREWRRQDRIYPQKGIGALFLCPCISTSGVPPEFPAGTNALLRVSLQGKEKLCHLWLNTFFVDGLRFSAKQPEIDKVGSCFF
jgi:hypothetical protein